MRRVPLPLGKSTKGGITEVLERRVKFRHWKIRSEYRRRRAPTERQGVWVIKYSSDEKRWSRDEVANELWRLKDGRKVGGRCFR